MDVIELLYKIVEYAPAVAILLWLNWRMDRQIARFLDVCLEVMMRPNDDQGE
jgi:hypothetical protein